MSGNVFKVAAKTITSAFKHQSSNLLIATAVVGVGALAYFVATETPEVNESLDKQKETKGEDLTVVEKAMVVVPGYRKSIGAGVVTVGAILLAHKCDLDKIALYSSAYGLANDRLDKLQAKVQEELGERKTQKIMDSINEDYIQAHPPVEANIVNTGKGVSLCMDNLTGAYFYSDRMHIDQAVFKIRAMIAEDGVASKNDWLLLLGLDPVADGDYTGWNKTNTPFSISYTSCLTADGRPCLVIDHSFDLPSPDFESNY